MKKKIKSKIEFRFFRLFYGLFKRLPYSFTERFMIGLFVFGGTILRVRRRVAEENLKTVYPQLSSKERANIIKKMYYFIGKTIAEIYFADRHELEKKLTVIGWEHLEEAISMNKGIIMASPHSGNWEFAGSYIAKRHPLAVVYKKLRNSYFDAFTNELRLQENIQIIHKKKSLKQIFKYLKDNFIITILIDQDARKHGIETSFLGKRASTYPGAARIALKMDVPIVPAIAIRDENENNVFIFEKMILPDCFRDREDAVKDLTEHTSGVLETYILQHPEHWFWVHRRWKGADKVMSKKGETE